MAACDISRVANLPRSLRSHTVPEKRAAGRRLATPQHRTHAPHRRPTSPRPAPPRPWPRPLRPPLRMRAPLPHPRHGAGARSSLCSAERGRASALRPVELLPGERVLVGAGRAGGEGSSLPLKCLAALLDQGDETPSRVPLCPSIRSLPSHPLKSCPWYSNFPVLLPLCCLLGCRETVLSLEAWPSSMEFLAVDYTHIYSEISGNSNRKKRQNQTEAWLTQK